MEVFHHPRYDIALGPLIRCTRSTAASSAVQRARRALGIELAEVSAPLPDAALEAFVTRSCGHSRPASATSCGRSSCRSCRCCLLASSTAASCGRCAGRWRARSRPPRRRWGATMPGTSPAATTTPAAPRPRASASTTTSASPCGPARRGRLGDEDRILVVDVDAHHGNGNASVFMDDARVTILDIYNAELYPRSPRPGAASTSSSRCRPAPPPALPRSSAHGPRSPDPRFPPGLRRRRHRRARHRSAGPPGPGRDAPC